MKFFIPIITLLLLGSYSLFPQSPYTSSNFSIPGDEFLISTLNLLEAQTINFDTTGANINWDFSNFNADYQYNKNIETPEGSGYQIPYIALCGALCLADGGDIINCGIGCTGEWGDLDLSESTNSELNLGVAALTNGWDLFEKNNQALQLEARGFSISLAGVPIPVITPFDSPDVIYDFPVEYGNNHSSNSSYKIDLTDLGVDLVYIHSQTRVNEVDGYGSLDLPYDTFEEVLKIKSTIYNRDTVIFYGDTLTLAEFLPSQIIPDTTIEYKWLDPSVGYPIVTATASRVLGQNVYSSVEFIDDPGCFGSGQLLFGYWPIVPTIDPETGEVDVAFFNLTAGGDSVHWNFDDNNSTSLNTNPTHTFTDAGLYNITLDVCSSICPEGEDCESISLPLLIIDTVGVVANYLAFPTTVCLGSSISFNNFSFNAETYLWDFGDGDTSSQSSPSHTFTEAGTYEVTMIGYNDAGSDTSIQTIEVLSDVMLEAGENVTICEGETVQLQGSSALENAVYAWTPLFSGLSCFTCLEPEATPSETTIYTLTVTSLQCGIVSTEVTVEVEPAPQVEFTIEPEGDDFTFEFSAPEQSANSYSWTFGDGGSPITESNPVYTYMNEGDYEVCLEVENDCGMDSFCETITVMEVFVEVTAEYSSASSVCLGSEISFDNSSSGATDYQWTFGDGTGSSTDENPDYTYSEGGMYEVTLIASNNDDIDTVTQTIEVIDYMLDAGENVTICEGDTAQLLGTSTLENPIYGWTPLFSDLSCTTCANPVAMPSETTTYSISTVTFDCGILSAEVTVEVLPAPQSEFISTQGINESTYEFSFTGAETDSFDWTFGDGASSTDQNPNHTYTNVGTYEVCLEVTNECGTDVFCENIIINEVIEAVTAGYFSFLSVCLGGALDFENTSSGATTYQWDFGDETTSSDENPSHIFTEEGMYEVSLIASNNNNSDTITQTINVLPPPSLAAFSANEGEDEFTYEMSFVGENADLFAWDFGDGSTSVEENPVHVFTEVGTYNVCLEAYNDCASFTICNEVVVVNTVSPIIDLKEQQLRVLSNPFQDIIHLEIENYLGEQEVQIALFNTYGQLIETHQTNDAQLIWNLSDLSLPNGLYFIQVKIDQELYATSLMKAK